MIGMTKQPRPSQVDEIIYQSSSHAITSLFKPCLCWWSRICWPLLGALHRDGSPSRRLPLRRGLGPRPRILISRLVYNSNQYFRGDIRKASSSRVRPEVSGQKYHIRAASTAIHPQYTIRNFQPIPVTGSRPIGLTLVPKNFHDVSRSIRWTGVYRFYLGRFSKELEDRDSTSSHSKWENLDKVGWETAIS